VRIADQYQPVIQLTAGTVVDVIVEEGFYLDDGKQHDNFDAAHPTVYANEKVEPTVLNLPYNPSMPLTLSASDVEKMKEQGARFNN